MIGAIRTEHAEDPTRPRDDVPVPDLFEDK
jgi:hypothetical protein